MELVGPALAGYSRPRSGEVADGGIAPRGALADVAAAEFGTTPFANGYAGRFLLNMNVAGATL